MSDIFIKGTPYNGHVLTIILLVNAGTDYVSGGITEKTHNFITSVDNLTDDTVTVTADGNTVTDALLEDLQVVGIKINDANPIYEGFDKDVPSDTLTTEAALTNGDVITIYYLAVGTGELVEDIRKKDLAEQYNVLLRNLKDQADAVSDPEINNLMVGLGFRRE